MEEIRLSNDEYLKILREFLNTTDQLEIISTEVKPIAEYAQGFLGTHYFITINYKLLDDDSTKTKLVFYKQLTHNPGIMFSMAKSIRAYDKEAFFYEIFMQECYKHKEVLDVSFAPRCYLSCSKSEKLVMEDLNLKQFKTVQKGTFLDIEHALLVLETLAKFHGGSIVCEERGKFNFYDKYGTVLDDVVFSKEDNLGAKWLRCSINTMTDIIDIMPEDGMPKSLFKEKVKELLENTYELVKPSTKLRNTLNHGDLWINNLMYRYENEVPTGCIIIDYQLLKYCPPVLDVVQLIQTSTRKSLRKAHWRELLDHYYSSLRSVLCKANLDVSNILPYDDFIDASRLFKIPAIFQAFSDVSITLLSDELMAEVSGDEETFRSFMFDDRTEYTARAYQTSPYYAEIIDEHLTELRDILMSYTHK